MAFEEYLDSDWWPKIRRFTFEQASGEDYASRIIRHINNLMARRSSPRHGKSGAREPAASRERQRVRVALVRTVLERLENGIHIHLPPQHTRNRFWQRLGFQVIESGDKLVMGQHRQ